jgi:hypothetical protein
MKLVLKPGERIKVRFANSDGGIDVQFNHNNITVKSDLPDTKGREGVIYREEFGNRVPIDEFSEE